MFRDIYYASKTFNEAQENYSTSEKRCWPWYLHVKNSGHIYLDPMSLSIMIMLQLNI